jgi:hypothetical protein
MQGKVIVWGVLWSVPLALYWVTTSSLTGVSVRSGKQSIYQLAVLHDCGMKAHFATPYRARHGRQNAGR